MLKLIWFTKEIFEKQGKYLNIERTEKLPYSQYKASIIVF